MKAKIGLCLHIVPFELFPFDILIIRATRSKFKPDAARVGQVEYLGNNLRDEGVPIVAPVGGYAVFLDARAILPDIAQERFPIQALTAALYVDAGVRTMERGAVSAGRDRDTGENYMPKLEMVRLALPRRVYTQAHMNVVVGSVARVTQRADRIKGPRFACEPEYLRFFRGRFEEVAD